MTTLRVIALMLTASWILSGCAVVTVVGAVVGAAATVAETAVSVGGAVVRTTAKGVEKAVDAVTGSSDEAAKAAK